MRTRVAGAALVIAGTALIAYSSSAGFGALRRRIVSDGVPFTVRGEFAAASFASAGPADERPALSGERYDKDRGETALTIDLPPAKPGKMKMRALGDLQLEAAGQPPSKVPLSVIPKRATYAAFAGMLIFLFGLPYLLLGRVAQAPVKTHDPWLFMLADARGGLSLGKVQLLLWFFPATALYVAFSVPMHEFAPIDATLAVLLGMSGLTTLFSNAANPKETARESRGGPRALSLRDLVEDFQHNGDLSRYQHLVLCFLGSVVFVVAAFDRFTIPSVPKEFLMLLGASQGTYVGTKAVKAAGASAARSEGARGG